MKVAGSRFHTLGTVGMALVGGALLAPSVQAAAVADDTVLIHAGGFYEEAILPPSDGSAWHANVTVVNGSARIDVYIIRTTELIAGYPGAGFAPLVTVENTTSANLDFVATNRAESYTLIVDNTDNARASDAVPSGDVLVHLVRPPPLRSSAQAQAVLGTGASICAGVLATATVGVAVYLKRRPRRETDEQVAEREPRIEIDVPIPEPPKGAWAREAAVDAEPGEEGR